MSNIRIGQCDKILRYGHEMDLLQLRASVSHGLMHTGRLFQSLTKMDPTLEGSRPAPSSHSAGWVLDAGIKTLTRE